MQNQIEQPVYRAIDLYSGVGGWSLGLRMANIEIVSSYEWWSVAADTQRLNLGDRVTELDIRKLDLSELPTDIDIVVGSPPCTQFSYANRGGSGDIADGLKDVYKFLEVVEHVSPQYWVMENIPRVAGILERELSNGGQLVRFREIVDDIKVVDCSDFGLPQRRKRMLAGSFPSNRLDSYAAHSSKCTLGQVIRALGLKTVRDLIYGNTLLSEELTDNDYEDVLDDEELRLNRDSKQFHRIYNIMPFPEPQDRTSRTITAAETRVSRESLIVEDAGEYRRLSLRERATLQGFPITYQFYGKSYSDRQKMIGNAIPPLLTYLIGRAITNISAEIVHEVPYAYSHELPLGLPTRAKRRVAAQKYRWDRRFRSVIPNLRFGSGVRFELSNEFEGNNVYWEVSFFYGASKNYRRVRPNEGMCERLLDSFDSGLVEEFSKERVSLEERLQAISASGVQRVWNHSHGSGIGPFGVLDILGETVAVLLEKCDSVDRELVESAVRTALNGDSDEYETFISSKKGKEINVTVIVGLLVGSWVNSMGTGKSKGD